MVIDTGEETSDSHRRALRRNRFIAAVAASGASKVVTLAVQLLALPFALRSLGTDRYVSFLSLQSFLSWTSLLGFGLTLSLPKFIAAADAAGNHHEQRNVVATALLLVGSASLMLMLALASFGLIISPAKVLAASKEISPRHLYVAYFTAVAVSSLQLFTSIQPSIRVGYQEFHRAGICSLIASLLFVLPGLSYVGTHAVSISTFILVLYGPLVALFFIDLGLLFRQRPYLRRGPVEFRSTARRILGPSGNALAFQFQFMLILYLPTLFVAHMTSSQETAAFGSILQLLVLGVSGLNLLFQPLMSAIANAHGHGEMHWIERNYKRSFLLVMAIGFLTCFASASVGPLLIRHWLGSSIHVSHGLSLLFGSYFFFLGLSLQQFYFLSAMGTLRGVGALFLIQGAISLGSGTLLCNLYGATGMVSGLAFGVAATLWPLLTKVRKSIEMEKASIQAVGLGPVAQR